MQTDMQRTLFNSGRVGLWLALAGTLVLAGCGGATNDLFGKGRAGSNGYSSLLSVATLSAGDAHCPAGGQLITAGLDIDNNNVLSASEVTSSQTICNGLAGSNSLTALVASSDVPVGNANCPAGGTLVATGLDANNNGVLDPSEVSNTRYICNGVAGAKGNTGDTGAAGYNTLTEMAAEAAGSNCATGGTKVTFGLDANRNNVLDSAEVSGTRFVCNGAKGTGALMTSLTLAPGDAHCAYGGSELVSGTDQDGTGNLINGDGSINTNNASKIDYACNGAPGAPGASGKNTLQTLGVLPVGDANCAQGGVRITAWLDLNGDGQLNGNEVPSTSYVCNGANGANGANGTNGQSGASTRIATRPVVAADNQCLANGGVAITSWLDLDGDGTVNGSEVPSTAYVCSGINGTNGTNGTNGANGANGLVIATTEAAGSNCTYGGTKIVSGIDLNGDNALTDTALVHEITGTTYACNGASGATGATGASGHNSLIKLDNVAVGDITCATGGRKVTTWLDSNDNGVLDTGEATQLALVCNGVAGAAGSNGAAGASGASAAISSAAFGTGTAKCAGGAGTTVAAWIDKNGNGQFDAGEPSNTFDVCNGTSGSNGTNGSNGANGAEGTNGSNGFNGLVIASNEPAGTNCAFGGTKLVSGTDLNRNNQLIGVEIASTSYACNGAPGAAGPAGPGIKVFLGSAGPQTYTVPAGVYNLVIEAWGGGGGGGNSWNCQGNFCAQLSNSAGLIGPGGGGGAGGYQKVLLFVTPGDTLAVSPGVAGTTSNPGNNNASTDVHVYAGGNSTVSYKSTTVVTAGGGAPGVSSFYHSDTGVGTNGAPGGGGSGSSQAPALAWTQSVGNSGSGSSGGYSVLGAGGNGQNVNAGTQGPKDGGTGAVVITPWQ